MPTINKKNYYFICIFFFFFIFNFQIKANEFNPLSKEKPFCHGNLFFNVESFNTNKTIPESIKIEFINQRKWNSNLFELIQFIGDSKYKHTKKIPQKYKKYFKIRLISYYKNGIECEFEGRSRVHGGTGDHISEKKLITSLNVELSDGSINNISSFILFLPHSRNADNEILTTYLLKKFDVLAPYTFNLNVKINNEENEFFLFQEKIDENFLIKNKKERGIVLAANKTYQIDKITKKYNREFDRLPFVAETLNANLNDQRNAINNLNYFFFQYYKLLKSNNFNNSLYYNKNQVNNVSFIKKNSKRINLNKFNTLDAFMIAMGSGHGLSISDRKYYFDSFYNKLEPIYYDGHSQILNNYNLLLDQNFTKKVFEDNKKGAKIILDKLKKIDLTKVKEELENLNFDVKKHDVENSLILLTNNLNIIYDSELIKLDYNFLDLDKKELSFFENNTELDLVFGGQNKVVELCKAGLIDCKESLASENELLKLYSRQVSILNRKNSFYVYESVDKFKKNIEPEAYGMEVLKNIRLNDENFIFFKKNSTSISIDRDNKKINITTLESDERIIFTVKDFNGWEINYKNANLVTKKIKKSSVKDFFPSGCLNFLDSEIKNIKLNISVADCPDALHFFRVSGQIDDIFIQDASFDALDSDFSNIIFKKVKVVNSKQECFGVKSGKYVVDYLWVNNCGDKGASIGETAKAFIKELIINNSLIGLVSKDSSEVYVNKYEPNNIERFTLASYKIKPNYTGSLIEVKEMQKVLDKDQIYLQSGSKIKIKNYEF